jgi:hypothetical protein
MMWMIDPTYLRTIVDGLSSGALQKDNSSALPQGLVGVYEEGIPPASQVNERKKFLEFFGVWALMKKEVSADFVVSLLDGWFEEEVIAFIGRYSKWFNSPASGVYTLYHERFRTFVLQKISGSQLRDINNRLIMACNDALTRRLNDEWERYALEYLSAHLLQPSLDTKERGSELKALAYNTNHWNRQIEISKGFDWSKKMLNEMMLWASKYDDDEVIECALNKVDLHHQEQNDAPRIVELVAQNDIETALHRIESFGGNDKEGLQRKFILYMLCLMELTLLGSKNQLWRKEAIEKLLKHLDDNLPIDHSVLNWNDFFPSYLIYLMVYEWSNWGVDIYTIYKYSENVNFEWLDNWDIILNEEEIEILILLDVHLQNKSLTFNLIKYLDKKKDNDYANDYSLYLTDENIKINLIIEDSKRLYLKGCIKEAKKQLNLVFLNQAQIIEVEDRINLLRLLSRENYNQGYELHSIEILQILYDIINIINDESKDYEISNLVDDYIFIDQIDKAILLIDKIEDPFYKIYAIISIIEKSKATKYSSYTSLNSELYNCLDKIEDDFKKGYAQSKVTQFIFKHAGFKEAFQYAVKINGGGGWFRDNALGELAIELIREGDVQTAIDIVNDNEIVFVKSSEVYMCAIKKYLKDGNSQMAVKLLNFVVDAENRNECFNEILQSYLINQNITLLVDFLSNMTNLSLSIDKYDKARFIREAIEYAIKKRIVDFDIVLASELFDNYDLFVFNMAQAKISIKENNTSDVDLYLNKAIENINAQESELVKDYLREQIIELYNKLNRINDSLELSKSIKEKTLSVKSIISSYQATYSYRNYYNKDYLYSELNDLRTQCLELIDPKDKVTSLLSLSNLAQKLEFEKMYKSIFKDLEIIVNREGDKFNKACMLSYVSTDLFRRGNLKESKSMIQEALSISELIQNVYDRNSAISNILLEILNQGDIQSFQNICTDMQLTDKFDFWRKSSGLIRSKMGVIMAFNLCKIFANSEFREPYIRGLIDDLTIEECNHDVIFSAIANSSQDSKALFKILQKHAIYLLFLAGHSGEKLDRFNRTLNIQWAIDIKNDLINEP